MENVVTIVIADDHPIFREGLMNNLQKEETFRIIAQTGDGLEALKLIRKWRPDVAILDIAMPGSSGIEIVRTGRRENWSTEFIILTMYTDEGYFNEAMDQGVNGYLLKECVPTELVGAVRAVASGRHYISPGISDALIERKTRMESLLKKMPSIIDLTPSEKRILRLLAENKTSNEIAEQLHISIRTVQNHRAHICRKLGIRGHNRLLQFAIENKSYL